MDRAFLDIVVPEYGGFAHSVYDLARMHAMEGFTLFESQLNATAKEPRLLIQWLPLSTFEQWMGGLRRRDPLEIRLMGDPKG